MKAKLFSMLAVAGFALANVSSAQAGLFHRHGGCCAPSCCEATCAAAPTCEAAPTCCAAEATCCAAPACCDTCCDTCCRPHRLRAFFQRLCHHHRCCAPTCCEATCCEPACAAPAPSCGCGY